MERVLESDVLAVLSDIKSEKSINKLRNFVPESRILKALEFLERSKRIKISREIPGQPVYDITDRGEIWYEKRINDLRRYQLDKEQVKELHALTDPTQHDPHKNEILRSPDLSECYCYAACD